MTVTKLTSWITRKEGGLKMTKFEEELGQCLVMLANKNHIAGWDKWLIGETYENDHCNEVYRLIMKLHKKAGSFIRKGV